MINYLTILNWFTTKKAYLAPYVDDDSAKKAATKLWTSVDKGDFIPFLAMLSLVIIICWMYYFPFNKQAGRHYHPKYWALFLVITLLSVFGLSFVLLNFTIAKNASFDVWFLVKCSLMNTLYAALVYIITSAIINRTGKSNAYPFI